MLLTVVKGATSFQHLRTVEGVEHPTFKTACLALGLLADDQEWIQCLDEARVMQTGSQLHSLFAIILTNCNPTFPEQLWERFKNHICDDLAHRLQQHHHEEDPPEERVWDYGLFLIDKLLQWQGKSLRDFPPMPLPIGNWEAQADGNRFIAEQQYDLEEQTRVYQRDLALLNAEQRSAHDQIIDSAEQGDGRVFFLNGPAGTGKSL